MPAPDEEVRHKLVGQWLKKAGQDLQAAASLLACEPPLPFPSCFHSQQAAEKYLKALLTARQVEFPKTHSIRELLNLVRTFAPSLADELGDSAALTVYGVEARYPGDMPEPDCQEATAAYESADAVRTGVTRHMREQVSG